MGAHDRLPTRRARAERLLSATSDRAALLKLLAAATAAVLFGAAASSTAAAATLWSQPATLSACPGTGAAQAVFPKDSPNHATGPGVVVWSTGRQCHGGEDALFARVGAGDLPTRVGSARAPGGRRLALRGPLAATGGPHGQVVIAGSSPDAASSGGVLLQGSATGPFSPLARTVESASPPALATGYLGDAAVASTTGGGSLQVRIERYFAGSFAAPLDFAGPGPRSGELAGAAQSLTVAMDYRTDAIAVWRQRGAIFARDLPASGTLHETERLAAAGRNPRISALLSDDNRAIVAWADHGAKETSVYLDMSSTGVRFGAPRLLERFVNPSGLPSPSASPRLIRLSSESVMLAWSGAQDGHWAVRAAAIDLHGLRSLSTISENGSDALLSDLEPGPDGEAIALWSEPQQAPQGQLDTTRQALYAARGVDASPGRTIFAMPELIAAPGPNTDPTVAIDPATDDALALWRGEGGALEYAIRSRPTPAGG